MRPGVLCLRGVAAVEDCTLLLSFSLALGVVLQSSVMATRCMSRISLVSIVVDQLWPHHPWVNL